MTLRPAVRYAIVAAIVLVVGGLFAYQQWGPGRASTYGVFDRSVRPEVGQKAPDFVLEENGSGRPIRLSDYRGRVVVLNFWATWCGPCRSEMPTFQKTYANRTGDEPVFLAVDYLEGDDLVTAFKNEFGLTFPLLMDRQGGVRQHYGAQGLPATFFIDRDGILRAQNLGPVVGDLLAQGLRAADQGSRTPPAAK